MRNKPKPTEEKRQNLVLRLPPETIKSLRNAKKKTGRTVTFLVEECLRDSLRPVVEKIIEDARAHFDAIQADEIFSPDAPKTGQGFQKIQPTASNRGKEPPNDHAPSKNK